MSTFTKTLIVDADPNASPDYHTITAAVNYLWNNGNPIPGTIIVEAGTYSVSSSSDTILIPSNVTIMGNEGVIINVSAMVPAFKNRNYDSNGTNSNIILSGFKIVVTMAANNYDSQVIAMKNVSDSIFEKLFITANYVQTGSAVPNATGILFYGTYTGSDYLNSNSVCKNNIVRQCKIKYFSNGICSNVTSSATISSATCIIQNNYISNCNVAIYAMKAYYLRIIGNTLTGSLVMNINIGESTSTIIQGNQITETGSSSGSHGLYPSGCTGMIISGNVVFKNYECGIKPRFSGTTDSPIPDQSYSIAGNVCVQNGQDTADKGNGIYLQGYARYQTLFGNNSSSNTATGIRLHDGIGGVSDSTIINNLIVGNVVQNNTDGQISNQTPTGNNTIASNIPIV